MAQSTDADTEKISPQTHAILKRAGEQAFGKTPTELSEMSPRNEQEVLRFYYDQMIEFFGRNRGGINEPQQFPFVLNKLPAESLLHLVVNYTGSLVTEDYEILMNSQDPGHRSKEILGKDEVRQGFNLVGKYLDRTGIESLNKNLKRISTDGLQYLDAIRTAARGSEQLKKLNRIKDTDKYQRADSWLKKLEAIKLPSAIAPEKPTGVFGRLFGKKD